MRRPLCFGLLLFLAVYLAAARLLPGPAGPDWNDWDGREAVFAGVAAELYEPADGSQEGIFFTLKHFKIISDYQENFSGEETPSQILSTTSQKEDSILLYLEENEKRLPKAGSYVKVRGVIQKFNTAANPGEFDAAAYYRMRGYCFSVKNAKILETGKEYDKTEEMLYQIRHFTDVLFWKILGAEDGAIASAMVLGIKKGMDKESKSLFQNAGISHLLAISGLHISFLGIGLFSLLKRLRIPLFPSAFMAAGFLFFYGQMTGMSVSTKRAVILFFLMLLATLAKRTSDLPTSLAVAACIILAPAPDYIADAGFQLSFSAVAGAAIVVPVLQETGIKPPHKRGGKAEAFKKRIFEAMTASTGITLSMLPFLLRHYYEWNPWSVAANLIVIPLMGILLPLLIGLAAAGLAGIWVPGFLTVLKAAALPARGILLLYKQVGRLVSSLPGSCLHTGMPKPWQTALFLCGLAALVLFGKKLRPLWRIPLAVFLTGIFLLRLPGNLQITMLDVGQGECVCVETPKHSVFLLDAGSSSESRAGQYKIVPFLKYSGVRQLRGIFISHWDADHVNALETVLEWARTGHVKVGGLFLPDTSLKDEGLPKLLALAKTYEVPVRRLKAGDILQDGELELTCLHPYPGEPAADRNASSCVLRLEYRDFTGLFTGDLEREGEQWLADIWQEKGLDCDLLDAGHHGAANATSEIFLDMASPEAVIISCGRNNRYGHPAPEMTERLKKRHIPYYVTAQRGAVIVEIEKERITVNGFIK